jgi:hypothetical protein
LTPTHLVRTAGAALAAASILSQSALAGGEPKNEWPFTRPAADRAPQAAIQRPADPAIQGEPKNQLPFTRPATVVVTGSGGGFGWTSGGIGAAAGVGVALAGAGALLVARKSPRTT